MHKLLILCLILFLGLISSQQPGVKLVLTQKGLNYAKDVGLQVLRREIANLKIPDQHGSAGTPIGAIEWWLSEVRVNRLEIPRGAIGTLHLFF
jgi:hypothetical protein